MKRITVLAVITALMINLENTSATTLTPAVVQIKRVTKNVRPHGEKPKLRMKSTLAILPLSPEELVVDDDLVLARNRNKIELVDEEEEELSDYVKIRLMIARMKAMKAYSMASFSKNSG